MAQRAVTERSTTVKLACDAFDISQTCYRYKAKLDTENCLIADWLERLTNNQRNWGLGLCFLYLRNVRSARAGEGMRLLSWRAAPHGRQASACTAGGVVQISLTD